MFLFISFKLVYFILIMGSVGFITLFERKILGMSQNRISVNKNTFIGLLQPLLDGLKLFLKSAIINNSSMKSFYSLAPFLMFLGYYLCWETNSVDSSVSMSFQFILLLSFIGLTVYGTITAGLVSFSKYSLMSIIRITLQTICFEVNITVIFFFILYCFLNSRFGFDCGFLNIYLFFLFFLMTMLETMRGCFDMGESESELVSGFNLEFASMSFVMMFLSEYSSIMFMSFIFWVFFMGFSLNMYFMYLLFLMFVRCFLVRLKIDSVVSFMWLKFLPYFIIGFVIFI